jgi:hypothetical protein
MKGFGWDRKWMMGIMINSRYFILHIEYYKIEYEYQKILKKLFFGFCMLPYSSSKNFK